jgi:hypothetical protein
MSENKLVQEALIQMKQVEEAIAENAKGILASTMKEEINQLVKESLSEQDEEDEVNLDADMEMSADNDDVETDMDFGSDDDMEMDFDMEMDSDEMPIDLTNASDEEILKVFKAMGENDGIIVKKDGDDVHLTDSDADVEYLVKLGESDNHKKKLSIGQQIFSKPYDEIDQDFIDDINSQHGDEEYEYFIDTSLEDGLPIGLRKRKSMGEMDEEDMMEEYDDMMEEEDKTTNDVIDAIFSGNMSGMDEEEEDMDEVVYEIEMDEEDMDDEDMDDEDMDEVVYEIEMDEEDMDDMTNETYKPKGVGIGKGPKFSYKDKAAGGFKEDKKQGPRTMGTGKAKFEYKKGANMEGKSKVVKSETKEGDYGMNRGDKSKTMKGKEDYTTKKGDTLKRKAFEKEETKEAARTYGMGSKEGRGLRKGITPNRNFTYGKNGVKTESTQEEVSMLRQKNDEYRKALNVFREKLNEVAIFNSNLAYATRLFTEHSTTKKEKINILRRFDDVETLKESKNLYKSIKDELAKVETKSINESVGAKLNKTVSTGSSTTLIETKTYENPQLLRMKDLISKLG